MNPSELGAQVRAAILELAWSQWTAIGVAGLGRRTAALVDPEALLVASVSVARWDARLFDEMLDWVASNGALLDASRLRRLGEAAGPAQRRLLLAILGSVASESEAEGLRRVEGALLAKEEHADYTSEQLFLGAPFQESTDLDEAFAAFGFRRPSPRMRGMSTVPDASSPPCTRFALRALVGVNARAEVLTLLLTHEWTHGRWMAKHGAYNQSAVADYLVTLAEAGQADRRTRGRRTEYRLAGLLRNAAHSAPPYVAWSLVWPVLVSILEVLSAEVSAEARWVLLADALERGREALGDEGFGLDIPSTAAWKTRGPGELVSSVDEIVQRCGQLSGDARQSATIGMD